MMVFSILETTTLSALTDKNMEDYDKIKETLAVAFMHNLDANRPEGKMCLSNGECADIENAFNEQDWPKLARYLDKNTESEDERIRKVIYKLMLGMREEIFTSQDKIVTKEKVLAYLEKQKEPKPAEWSEEDDWKRKELIQYLEEKGDYRTVWMTWLKSLRPQPHWKPTEEQIKGLKFFLDFHRPQRNAGTTNWKEFDAVESLYNDIRKL